MGLDISSMLTPSRATLYGIISGNAATLLGSVILLVTFGMKDNYRTEYIKFQVADFESSYHAILGRPALARFMAVPHYVYLLLKMPGKIGILCLADQLHRNIEAYVDDVVIKTRSHDEFIPDLEETFNSLCKFRWKLNPTKCIFGMPQRKLLGFIVSH
jgi:hypothetical protein